MEGIPRPDVSHIMFPTPEMAETFAANHECYWLSTDRKSYGGKDHVSMLIEHRGLFGFTQAEIDYAQQPQFNKQEMVDRYLHLYEVAIERGWICILVNKLARSVPGMPMAAFWFFAESVENYDRITAWLKSHSITQGTVRLKTIMMRTWDQPVQSLFARTQYSKSGSKLTCPTCGTEMGQEELVVKGTCPRCGTQLW